MKNKVYLAIGALFVGLGFVGVFLPLMPTTPFLLVSLFCFSRGSARSRQWLVDHRLLGPYVRAYVDKTGMSVRIKLRTLVLMWSVCLLSGIFATSLLWVRIALGVIAIGVTVHILLMKTPDASKTDQA